MSLITWTNNSMTATASGINSFVYTNIRKNSGRWYWEVVVNSIYGSSGGIGVHHGGFTYYSPSGNRNYAYTYGSSYSVGDIIGVAVDIYASVVTFYKNGVSQGAININITSEFCPFLLCNGSGHQITVTANFGAIPFQYPIPKGYLPYDYESAKISWFFELKHLIKSFNKFYLLSEGEWQETSLVEPLTELDFETYGMDSLDGITHEKLQELEDDEFEVITWTNEKGEELQGKLIGTQVEWLEEGKLFETVVTEDIKIKSIVGLNVE